jgi:hypothetical protein
MAMPMCGRTPGGRWRFSAAERTEGPGDPRENIEYASTHVAIRLRAHTDGVSDELTPHESALRKLPLPYSLALRLREAGVAPEVVSEYVGVDEAALAGVYRIAEAKLSAAELLMTPCQPVCHSEV